MDNMRKDLIKFQENLCGNKLTYKNDQLIDGTKFTTAMLGDVEVERFNDGVRQRTSIPKKYLNL